MLSGEEDTNMDLTAVQFDHVEEYICRPRVYLLYTRVSIHVVLSIHVGLEGTQS